MRATLAVCLGMLSLAAMPGSSLAQDREQARVLFDEAAAQFEASNYLLALEKFRQSRDLMEGDGRAQTLILFNIARTLEELHRYREALATFERYLADAPPDAPYFEQTRDRVRELRLRVASMPAGGSVHLAGPIVLGTGSVALAAGLLIGALSLGQASEFRSMCDDLTMCPAVLRPQYDEMRAFSAAADVLYVAGGLTAALGLVLTLALHEGGDETAAAVGVNCGPDGCRAVLEGRF